MTPCCTPGLASPECSTGSFGYSQRWWLSATIPFMLMAPFVLMFGVSQSKAVHSIMVVLAISYIFAISTAMEAWVCRKYGKDGTFHLVAYPDITCDASDLRWQGMMAGSFFLFLFFFFGVNTINYILLGTIDKDDEDMKLRYGFLFLRYKDGCHMWELVNNARKFLTVIAGVAISRSGVGQASMMLVVVLAALALQITARPYVRSRSNALERNLLLIQIAQLILSLICEVSGSDGDAMAGLLLTALFLGMFLVALEFALIICDMIQGRGEKPKTEDEGDKRADTSDVASAIELVLE